MLSSAQLLIVDCEDCSGHLLDRQQHNREGLNFCKNKLIRNSKLDSLRALRYYLP